VGEEGGGSDRSRAGGFRLRPLPAAGGSPPRNDKEAAVPEPVNAVHLLRQDHREAEQLFARIEAGGGAGPDDAVQEVVRELSVHAAIEEQVLYPAVREKLDGGDELADHAIEEHQAVKELLAEIDGSDDGTGERRSLLARLMMEVRSHVEEEEADLFPKLQAAFGPQEQQELGQAMAEAKRMAPTRPHPKAPSTPPGNVVAGAAAAVVDKARDALRRG
jgi:hemerythrin superfamily protein